MDANAGDTGVFVHSMSARGTLGGLSGATAHAVTALDVFGTDGLVVETVGAGQNEVDVVRTADTVCVSPTQMWRRGPDAENGHPEIAGTFVLNKADLAGSDRLVSEPEEMVELGDDAGSHRIADPDPGVVSGF